MSQDASNRFNPSGSWMERKVDEKDYRAFIDALTTDAQVHILDQVPIGGGYSGARTDSILIDGSHDNPNNRYGLYGHYVLKVSHKRDGEREDVWQAIASQSEALQGRVPELHRPLIPGPGGKLVGVFYRVADGTILDTQTLKDRAGKGAPAPAFADTIARTLLSYNRSRISDAIPHKDQAVDQEKERNVFVEIRNGAVGKNSEDLRLAVERVLDKPTATFISLPPRLHDSFPLLNPNPYMDPNLRQWPAQPRKHAILKGPLHGDLHLGNIVVPTNRQLDDNPDIPQSRSSLGCPLSWKRLHDRYGWTKGSSTRITTIA